MFQIPDGSKQKRPDAGRVPTRQLVASNKKARHDYTILDTEGPALSYHPDKLSMERVGDQAFGPEDRIGQLTMRNLDIADSRARLEQYAELGIVGGATAQLVGEIASGRAAEILAGEAETDLDAATDAANEAAAFDLGTD